MAPDHYNQVEPALSGLGSQPRQGESVVNNLESPVLFQWNKKIRAIAMAWKGGGGGLIWEKFGLGFLAANSFFVNGKGFLAF